MLPKFSCAIAGFSKNCSVFDAVKTVKDAGFDGVDFSLSTYSRKENAALLQHAWWREWTQAVKTYLDELQLPVLQAHAAWDQIIPKDLTYISPEPILYRNMEACAMLGCKKLVFHPLLYPYRVASESLESQIHDYNVRWFGELLPTAERLGIKIELENMFDYYHVQQPGDPPYLYTAAAQLLRLRRALDSRAVGFCLDTGHANISGQDPAQMIAAYGTELDCLHLNDNYGRAAGLLEDLHLFPGEGTLRWQPIFRALQQTGYDGTYNLELIADLGTLSPQKRVERLFRGREALREMVG